MRILVTGSTGHIGPNLVRRLAGDGHTVRVLVRATSPTRPLEGLDVERVVGGVTDADAVRAAVDGVDVVFNVAGVISLDGDQGGVLQRVNVEAVRTLARAALDAGVSRLVHMSSVHAYAHADPEAVLTEESARPGPDAAAYDRSKAAGEAALREVVADGLDAVVVSPTSVLGPEDWGPSRLGGALRLAARGLVPLAPPGGFDFVDVRDVVEGTIAALERGRTGASYLLPGRWWPIRDVLALVPSASPLGVLGTLPWSASGALVPPMRLVAGLTGSVPFLTSEALHTLATGSRHVSGQRALDELGWEARIPLERSVDDTLAWFREQGMLGRRRRA